MIREEHNLPLTADAYQHLKEKIDGRLIVKDRYIIPLESDPDLLIELDFFKNELEDLILAEVEFPDKASADRFLPPAWFGDDVTFSSRYHNSTLSLSSARE